MSFYLGTLGEYSATLGAPWRGADGGSTKDTLGSEFHHCNAISVPRVESFWYQGFLFCYGFVPMSLVLLVFRSKPAPLASDKIDLS